MTEDTLNHYATVAGSYAKSDPWFAELIEQLVAEVKRLREELAAVDALAEEAEVVGWTPGAQGKTIWPVVAAEELRADVNQDFFIHAVEELRAGDLVTIDGKRAVSDAQLESYFDERRAAHVRLLDGIKEPDEA